MSQPIASSPLDDAACGAATAGAADRARRVPRARRRARGRGSGRLRRRAAPGAMTGNDGEHEARRPHGRSPRWRSRRSAARWSWRSRSRARARRRSPRAARACRARRTRCSCAMCSSMNEVPRSGARDDRAMPSEGKRKGSVRARWRAARGRSSPGGAARRGR